jgi:hypothetical protein
MIEVMELNAQYCEYLLKEDIQAEDQIRIRLV